MKIPLRDARSRHAGMGAVGQPIRFHGHGRPELGFGLQNLAGWVDASRIIWCAAARSSQGSLATNRQLLSQSPRARPLSLCLPIRVFR